MPRIRSRTPQKGGIAACALLFLIVAAACRAQPRDRVPVTSQPCEGCEAVFVGMPDSLSWHTRIAPEDEPGEPMIVRGTVYGPGHPGARAHARHRARLLHLLRRLDPFPGRSAGPGRRPGVSERPGWIGAGGPAVNGQGLARRARHRPSVPRRPMKSVAAATVLGAVCLFGAARSEPEPVERATVLPAVPVAEEATDDDATLRVDTSRSLVRWKGTEMVGSGHEGVVRLADGGLCVRDGAVTGGAFAVDLRTIAVTDISRHEPAPMSAPSAGPPPGRTAQRCNVPWPSLSIPAAKASPLVALSSSVSGVPRIGWSQGRCSVRCGTRFSRPPGKNRRGPEARARVVGSGRRQHELRGYHPICRGRSPGGSRAGHPSLIVGPVDQTIRSVSATMNPARRSAAATVAMAW